MDKVYYHEGLEIYKGDIPLELEHDLQLLKDAFGTDSLKGIFGWNESKIAIPIDVRVNLPSRGTANNIDIREIESILLIFDLNLYPSKSPLVKSNRISFPRKDLSHIYISKKDTPISFCLIDGNLDEWFSGGTIIDLVKLTQIWLSKAGCDELSTDGNKFEPLRLNGYSDSIIYSYSLLYEIVNKNNSRSDNFLPFMLEISKNIKENQSSFKFLFPIDDIEGLGVVKSIITKFNDSKSDLFNPNKSFGIGALIWSDNKIPIDYFSEFPSTYFELKEFCSNKLKIDIESVVNFILRNEVKYQRGIQLILAIKRPKQIMGFDGDLEFINCNIYAPFDTFENGQINNKSVVSMQLHKEKLTIEKAKQISSISKLEHGNSLFLGAGALGSKIILHLARAGITSFLIADNKKLAPHNLVRHGLLGDSVNTNKADALSKEIEKLYGNKIETFKEDLHFLKIESAIEFLKVFDYIVDTTASNSICNLLSNLELKHNQKIIKCEIANKGKLGFLYIEGKERTPRIDDLIISLYRLGLKNVEVRKWLNLEKLNNDIEKGDLIQIGIGCHSSTLIMSDDNVSFHASVFSKIIKDLPSFKANQKGTIVVSFISDKFPYKSKIDTYKIDAYQSFETVNNSKWEVRLSTVVVKELQGEFDEKFPNETGGVLIGTVNLKSSCIYVTDIITEPKDSQSSPYSFVRGIDNLPQSIDKFKNNTGDIIGYVGEWHTHPHGPEQLSNVDYVTLAELSEDNKKINIPTFVIINTPTGIKPYVFD